LTAPALRFPCIRIRMHVPSIPALQLLFLFLLFHTQRNATQGQDAAASSMHTSALARLQQEPEALRCSIVAPRLTETDAETARPPHPRLPISAAPRGPAGRPAYRIPHITSLTGWPGGHHPLPSAACMPSLLLDRTVLPCSITVCTCTPNVSTTCVSPSPSPSPAVRAHVE